MLTRLSVLMGLCLPLWLVGQEKYEREYRLPVGAVPVEAQAFVAACSFERRVRWYGEVQLRGRSIEAKVKEDGRRYSLEFDTLGRIEDVEVQRYRWEVPDSTWQRISDSLGHGFTRFQVKKIQEQWTGPGAALIARVRGDGSLPPVTVRYEVVVRGRRAGEVNWYEFLFTPEGRIERRERLVFRNTDHLDY